MTNKRARFYALVALPLLAAWATAPVFAQPADAGPAESAPDAEVGAAGNVETKETPSPSAEDSSSEAKANSLPGEGEKASLRASTGAAEPIAGQAAEASASRIRYFLDNVKVRGNRSTTDSAIRHFVPLERGELLDIDDPSIEAIRWRLMGTGWFDSVKLSLERGSKRGWVVLVITVVERNTLVITSVVAGISKAVRKSSAKSATAPRGEGVTPYGGLGIAETNLLGLGIGVSFAGVYSEPQQGIDLRYADNTFLGSAYSLNGRFFYNNARDFFGKVDDTWVDINCRIDPNDPSQPPDPDCAAKTAVVIYKRYGLSLGTGRDLTSSLRFSIDWQGELVHVTDMPEAATTMRGDERVPIDFNIEKDWSTVSTVHFGLIFDRRDDPALPSRGHMATFDSRLGAGILGSRYDFVRLESAYRVWLSLPWGHVLSPGAFAGMVFGDAPFFYHFYASDLSDLIPSRVMELNLDHRGPHNLLGTSIGEMRMEDLAAKIDLEYSLSLYRGSGGFRGVQAYARAGLYALSSLRDVRVAIQGYHGWELLPVDLAFDIGVRADTSVGLFQLGFSTLMGFLPEL